MNIIIKASLSLLLLIPNLCNSGDFLKQFVKNDSNQKFFVGLIEEKQKLLEEFEKEQTEQASADKAFTEKISRQIAEVKTLLTNVESGLQKNPDDDFLIKQQLILKESDQVLKDTQRINDDSNSLLNEII